MWKQTSLGIAALLWVAGNSTFAADTSPAPPTAQEVRYDASTDRLNVEVQNRSLTDVLAQISRQSGVVILADPNVDHPVTASLQNQPLEDALGDLTRGMNAVMIHDERDIPGQGRQPVLTRLELLPVGQTNTALLRPVLSPEAEALMRAKGHDPAGSLAHDRVDARRQARLEKMDPAQRERVEKHAAERTSRRAEEKAAKTERQAKKQQDRLQHLNNQLAQLQAQAATNPEGSQQRIQQLNQKIARIQQGNAPAASGSTP
jgi:hypothetical protein